MDLLQRLLTLFKLFFWQDADVSSEQSVATTASPSSHAETSPALPHRTSTARKEPQRLESEGVGAHFFQGATNVNITGSTMLATVNVQEENYEHLRLVDAQVAPHAILNAGGRADEVRCYPGTRWEVISRLENWIRSGYREDRRIFWLSGPAGAGKSAIMQTLAENCIKRGTPMANFFFFRADSSRNHSHPIVATLLHQLLQQYPALKSPVNEIIGLNRLILEKSIRDQMTGLIENPVRSLRRDSPNTPPIVLLIDGLDECDPRPELDTAAKSEQRTLLHVIHGLVTSPDSPFIAAVASRAEAHIAMTVNEIGRTRLSIYLDEKLRPEADIRTFITGELARIKHTHTLGQYTPADWPSELIVQAILEKSSGQFIYAATVCRFVENCPQSPALSMQMVMAIRPANKHSPFADIDAIYLFILSRCAHWVVAGDVIGLHQVFKNHNKSRKVGPESRLWLSSLPYDKGEIASFFSDLTSIIEVDLKAEAIDLKFFHASFLDFIYNRERAGGFHVDSTHCVNSFAPTFIDKISDILTFTSATTALKYVDKHSNDLTRALERLSKKRIDLRGYRADVYLDFCMLLRTLYQKDHNELLEKVNNTLAQWFNGYPDDEGQ